MLRYDGPPLLPLEPGTVAIIDAAARPAGYLLPAAAVYGCPGGQKVNATGARQQAKVATRAVRRHPVEATA